MTFTARPRSNARRLLAGTLVLAVFGAMRRSADRVGFAEPSDLPSRFAFTRTTLPEIPGAREARPYRHVHPYLHHIQAFVSSLGAAAALNDLDGNGLPDDLCRVETLTDRVLVSPVPGTGDRYAGFALDDSTFVDRERMVPSNCLVADFDEDGHPDILVSYAGRTPLLFTWWPVTTAGAPALSAANYVPTEVVPGGGIWTT